MIKKDNTEEIIEKEITRKEEEKKAIDTTKEAWRPKTELGKKVKSGEVKNIDEILARGLKIMEVEIIDILLPNLKTELLMIGQSKGKFGGGKRSIWKQTQKKTKEGNKPKFATMAVVGNYDGYVGIGYSKSRETVPARERATRNAKLNLIKVRRGCGEWTCACNKSHSIPFKVEGKCGSIRLTLKPAPQGVNLCVEEELKKVLGLAGIKDIYSKTKGQTRTRINLIKACFFALKRLNTTKIKPEDIKKLRIIEGINQ